jgi:hypothetical protein
MRHSPRDRGDSTESVQEPLPIDDDPGDLAVADDRTVGMLGDDLEAEQPAVDMCENGSYDDSSADGTRPLVGEADSRADRRALGSETVVDRLAGRGFAPRQQSRGREDGEIAAAERNGRVGIGDRTADGRRPSHVDSGSHGQDRRT